MRTSCNFTYQGKPFEVPLESSNGKIYCSIRNKPVAARAEEFVRQETIHFLEFCKKSLSYPIHILVERQGSMDIVVYAVPPVSDFAPACPPVLIIETKRTEIQLGIREEQQLIDYLKRERCLAGILTNGISIQSYQGENYRCSSFTDLAEVEALIQDRVDAIIQPLKLHQAVFEQAQIGCFESFRDLANIYGKDSVTKFQFARRESQELWTGLSFQFNEDQFSFRTEAGKKRKNFCKSDFQRLLRIKSLYDLS